MMMMMMMMMIMIMMIKVNLTNLIQELLCHRTFLYLAFTKSVCCCVPNSGVATGWYGGGNAIAPHFCQKMVLEIPSKSKRKWWGIGLVKFFPRNGRMRLRN